VQNALKFTEAPGRVTVRLAAAPGNGPVSFTVEDTGIGIDPAMLPRVFDPFTQDDASLDRSRGGLGLGLALVKGIAELHGGRVTAESEGPGQGARFTVELPIAEQPLTRGAWCLAAPAAALTHIDPHPPCSAKHQAPGARRRVLIVEDNVDAAESLREWLELSGYSVSVAHSGPQGLEAARNWRPEVILCDLGLPGMSGYEVAAALRREPELAGARLIAVTGYGQEEHRRRARDAGFDLHLTKPLDLTELKDLLGTDQRYSA
jgi:CheY-like chemotaxis protein